MSARLLALLSALVVLVALDQAAQHLLLADGYLAGRRIAPFDPPLFFRDQEEAYARLAGFVATGEPPEASFRLDPELGWYVPRDGNLGPDRYDAHGARVGRAPIPRERVPGMGRIVAIGCSFTEGAEVRAHEGWTAQLEARHPELEVANLGVGAYGLDQALLRWRRDGRPLDPDEVWLGWLPSATARLLTLYHPAQRHWGLPVAFKPRFVLDPAGGLALVPCPAGDVRAAHALIGDAEAFMAATGEHDAWVAACPAAYAPRGSHPLHWSAAGRVALTMLERRGRDMHARLQDPEDEATRLVIALVLAARAEAEAAGARFRLLVLPGADDLRAAEGAAEPPWGRVTAELAAQGVLISDLSGPLLAAGGAGAEELWAPGGHYSPRGNALVAADLSAELHLSEGL